MKMQGHTQIIDSPLSMQAGPFYGGQSELAGHLDSSAESEVRKELGQIQSYWH